MPPARQGTLKTKRGTSENSGNSAVSLFAGGIVWTFNLHSASCSTSVLT